MNKATYILLDGSKLEVEYDPSALCISCGEPVIEASMCGTAICPWCDCGTHRDGRKWTFKEMMKFGENVRRNREGGDD